MRMTVRELIKKLKTCNQEANVSIVTGNVDGENDIDTYDFEAHYTAKEDEYIELFVNVNTCINQI